VTVADGLLAQQLDRAHDGPRKIGAGAGDELAFERARDRHLVLRPAVQDFGLAAEAEGRDPVSFAQRLEDVHGDGARRVRPHEGADLAARAEQDEHRGGQAPHALHLLRHAVLVDEHVVHFEPRVEAPLLVEGEDGDAHLLGENLLLVRRLLGRRRRLRAHAALREHGRSGEHESEDEGGERQGRPARKHKALRGLRKFE
jgi:hypothetical protein